MNLKQQRKINDFSRQYLDKSVVLHWNRIKPTGTSYDHFLRVCRICWYLHTHNIPYCTESKFVSGYEPDIICPTYIKPIIEVRHSETDKKTQEKIKRIPEELHDEIIYVGTDGEFKEEMIQ